MLPEWPFRANKSVSLVRKVVKNQSYSYFAIRASDFLTQEMGLIPNWVKGIRV